MAPSGDASSRRKAVIGNKKSFWLYDSDTGFDLTHPETPESPAISPSLTIKTTTSPITIDPAKSALVIIDMQNYFLRYEKYRAPEVRGYHTKHACEFVAPHSDDQEDPAMKPVTSSFNTPSQQHAKQACASSGSTGD